MAGLIEEYQKQVDKRANLTPEQRQLEKEVQDIEEEELRKTVDMREKLNRAARQASPVLPK